MRYLAVCVSIIWLPCLLVVDLRSVSMHTNWSCDRVIACCCCIQS